jgi:3-deoxy-D-manno-octulosonate 8-phosphate phosphatase KdsC-like HAD superfamily phosphatase
MGIAPEHTMFVGNDINDIPAFESIGVPVAVADAYPEVEPYILFRTKKPGGFGAVREVCDLIFHAKSGSLSGI